MAGMRHERGGAGLAMHLLADILSVTGSFGLLFGAYLLAQQIEREHFQKIQFPRAADPKAATLPRGTEQPKLARVTAPRCSGLFFMGRR